MPEPLGRLAALVAGELRGDATAPISDVVHDSRMVDGPTTLFVAMPGERFDGHDFVGGLDPSIPVVVERWLDHAGPQLLVPDARAVLGVLADAVHGSPSASMDVIGVTGTNGKTSVTHLLADVLRSAGRAAAVIGTTGVFSDGARAPLARTTPEASDLHRLLRTLRDAGTDVACMEVSSHALSLGRVDGVRFRSVAFTNLSHDHLDFHGTMEAYFEAKASLFARSDHRVIQVTGPWGARLADRYPAMRAGEDPSAHDVRAAIDRTGFRLRWMGAEAEVNVPFGGSFTVENALVAAGLALDLGVSLDDVAQGLSDADPIPGRFEPIRAGQPFGVVVDYAHSPAAITAAIESAAAVTPGRVIVVVGAGGDRDTAKRAPMGEAAGAADVVVLTSDNPRSEDPDAILDAVEEGALRTDALLYRDADRARGIGRALALADGGDSVLILGKGHEATQEVGGRFVPFDDRDVARSVLEESYP
ncbi:MAG: UDP-N-acetylmuramoyl-L-alanyl-D-glutamate--2,6-diaminopimelate ligase [Acidimicrobiia bacterium]|nr:UDP-N-acetylmuramoyl-L-alanyl-D-glutamate--2,6-diaminopimelate ligase [Acidimicrobiia bacterium]